MEKCLSFLRDLKKNNNREWFQANRIRYEECRAEHLEFIETLISGAGLFDPELGPVNPKSTVFRINRDIRFSKDKSPYKTHFGAFINRYGRSLEKAGYYFHLEPGGSFIGGGIYRPGSDVLKKIRQEIFEDPEEFSGIVREKKFREFFGGLSDDRLVNAPKGYPKDFEYIDLLKYKSYMVSRELEDEQVTSDGLADIVLKGMRIMYPMIRFVNNALE